MLVDIHDECEGGGFDNAPDLDPNEISEDIQDKVVTEMLG